MSLFWFILAAIAMRVLNQSKAGNSMRPRAAIRAGAVARVDVDGTKVSLFVLSSLMASVAGVISSIRTSAANPNSGTGYELEVIAMVVIGGTALTGGRGTIFGTVLGISSVRHAQRHRADRSPGSPTTFSSVRSFWA